MTIVVLKGEASLIAKANMLDTITTPAEQTVLKPDRFGCFKLKMIYCNI